MNINWYGQSCFLITSVRGKGEVTNIIIDPFDESIGLRVPKMEANVLLTTHDHKDHNNAKAVSGNPFLINGPGEYEVKEVFIQGIQSYHDENSGKDRGVNTIYTLETEDIKICHLGDLGQKELTSEQLEQIGDVDILMIPVGGNFTISAKEAGKIMSQIGPSIVIPMHYSIPKLKIKLDSLDLFLKAVGVKSPETLAKLSIKKKDIVSEESKVIVLNS
ncbi:MAG: MBL fold metallo-hydrolase [Candidatus Nealsonbacteria bacterium]